MPSVEAIRDLYDREIVKHVLALREALVRHDENLAAFRLLEQCTPYFLQYNPQIMQARADQYEMVKHLFDPTSYAKEYEHNLGETSFEEQVDGKMTIAQVDVIPRVGWLVERLAEIQPRAIADLGCNDGWMLRHLADRTDIDVRAVAGVDLNVDCIERARARFLPGVGKDGVAASFAVQSIEEFGRSYEGELFDAVSCFEVLEHVLDPYAVLDAARAITRRGGMMFFSTPFGAVELGCLPAWAEVRYKGHVRAVLPPEFGCWLVYAKTGRRSPPSTEPVPLCDMVMSGDVQNGLMLGYAVRVE